MKQKLYETPEILVIPMLYHEDVCQNTSLTSTTPEYEVDEFIWEDEDA